MNEIIKAYREDYPGRKVEVSYGGHLADKNSGTKSGDLYLAADTSYIQIAQEKDLLRNRFRWRVSGRLSW